MRHKRARARILSNTPLPSTGVCTSVERVARRATTWHTPRCRGRPTNKFTMQQLENQNDAAELIRLLLTDLGDASCKLFLKCHHLSSLSTFQNASGTRSRGECIGKTNVLWTEKGSTCSFSDRLKSRRSSHRRSSEESLVTAGSSFPR